MIIPGCVLGWEKESEKGGKNSEKSNNVYDIYIYDMIDRLIDRCICIYIYHPPPGPSS